jgi:hypothetical protein
MSVKEIIIKNSYSEEDIYCDVYVQIVNKKEASQVLQRFAEEVPLQAYGLSHLKRIQPLNRTDKMSKLQVILCPVKKYEELPISIRDSCKEKLIVKVSKLQPECRSEFDEWNKCWPINFHSTQLEKEQELGLSKSELEQLNTALSILNQSSTSTETIEGVLINPENGKVVATTAQAISILRRRLQEHQRAEPGEAKSSRSENPSEDEFTELFCKLYTPTMLCIESMAAVVRGDSTGIGNSYVVTPSVFLSCGVL